MDLNGDESKVSPELREFIVNEQIKAQIQQQIRKFNSICFDRCIDKPGSKLESKQETCLENCVGRYLDSNGFIANRFAKRAAKVPTDSFS